MIFNVVETLFACIGVLAVIKWVSMVIDMKRLKKWFSNLKAMYLMARNTPRH